MSTKKPVKNPDLQTWVGLNEAVMNCADEAKLQKLLTEELKGRKRKKFLERIHSRINKLRAERERAELHKVLEETDK